MWERAEFPDPSSIDLLVIMGGTLSVNDEDQFTWLRDEKKWIRRTIDAGTPTLGICLGSQLIANALGADVRPNGLVEHGWLPVEGLDTSNGNFRFPAAFTVFQSHGDTFAIPDGAMRIAQSEACANQAFQYGEHVLALQFHLESTAESAGAIVEECATLIAPGPYVQSPAELRAAPPGAYDSSAKMMNAVLRYLIRE